MTVYYSYNDNKLMNETEVKEGFDEYKEYVKYLSEFSNEEIQKMLETEKTVDEIDDISYSDLWNMLKDEHQKILYKKAFEIYIKDYFLVREF